MTTNSFTISAHLAVLRHRADKALRAAQPLLTSAPDARVSSDCEHPDPTADIVLHPKRMEVADAYGRTARLMAAIDALAVAESTVTRLEDAIDAWHGLC